MPQFTPQYIDREDLKRYLLGKIQNGVLPTEFDDAFLDDMCAKGESVVERDLSKIYLIPFTGFGDDLFTDIPTSSQAYVTNLCIVQAALLLLRINFGGNSSTTGANYVKFFEDYYNIEKDKILPKGTDGLYKLNPILGLAINTVSFTGQISAPLPIVENPLAGRDNITKTVERLPIVDRAIGLNFLNPNIQVPPTFGEII